MGAVLSTVSTWVKSLAGKILGTMSSKDTVIAVAGVGDLGKFICEELQKAPGLKPIVLTRNETHDWCTSKAIPFHPTDYSVNSLRKIFNDSQVSVVISVLNIFDREAFLSVHRNLISACQRSAKCKRFVPSEWVGDIESYPLSPPFYAETRVPIRKLLESQTEIEHTAICPGWLVDHFVPAKKTYMKHVPFSPIEPDEWKALVRGTGDETVSFVLMRDAAIAVAALCKANRGSWDPVTYIAGGWATFNQVIAAMERIYGKEMPRQYRSLDDIRKDKEDFPVDSLPGISAQIEEMGVLEHFSVPEEKTLKQREKFFVEVNFRGLDEALRHSQTVNFV